MLFVPKEDKILFILLYKVIKSSLVYSLSEIFKLLIKFVQNVLLNPTKEFEIDFIILLSIILIKSSFDILLKSSLSLSGNIYCLAGKISRVEP